MTQPTNVTNGTVRITRDEDGNWVIPDGMCQVVSNARDFDGSDIDVPCGANGDWTVKYDLFIPYDPETGETDFWSEATETVCSTHKGEMESYADEHPEEMRITSMQCMSDETDITDKSIDWYSWYENIPNQD